MGPPQFKPGMKLEAKDRLNPSLVCVATVASVRNDGKELLIHFDGWTEEYDYWCEADSTDIHPMDWCLMQNDNVLGPKGTSLCSWK